MMKKLLITMAVVATAGVLHAGPKSVYMPPTIDKPMTSAAWYVGAYGGGSFWQSDFINPRTGMSMNRKIGWDAGMKVGYDFNTAAPVRLVLELDGMFTGFNRSADMSGGGLRARAPVYNEQYKWNVRSFSLMANALAKFDCGAFQPYLGAGAGFHTTRITSELDGVRWFKESCNGFAWQVLAGSDYKLDANWALFAEYKWVNYQIPKGYEGRKIGMVKSNIGQQLVNLGVRYTF